MDITNEEKIKDILKDLKKLFMELEYEKKKLENQISVKEDEQQDWLHELELGNLNGLEMVKAAKEIRDLRIKRREHKDKLAFLNTIKGFVDKFITKGIIPELDTVLKNIETLEKNNETRVYNSKVVKNLKCSKRK